MTRGRRSLSRILAAGQRSEIGLKEVLTAAGFPGLAIGIANAFFYMTGMSASPTKRLNRAVR
jgi:hypothetical protein